MSLFDWVRLGTFPSSGHVCLLRERVVFEKPRGFALMHFEASHDFFDWLFKRFLFCGAKNRARLIHRHFSVEATSAASAEIIFDVICSRNHLSN